MAAAVPVANGFGDALVLTYVAAIMTGLLGVLVATREPRNSIGWLMCAASLATGLGHLPFDYGYTAQVVEHGSWPLGEAALWLSGWAWVPVLGLALPLISVRFPNGRVAPRWRLVDWLAIAGTGVYTFTLALTPVDTLARYVGSPASIAPYLHSPLSVSLAEAPLSQIRVGGLALILLAYVASAASLASRFQRARGDERLQLKWLAYAEMLTAVTAAYAGLGVVVLHQPVEVAFVPFGFAVLTLPLAIGIAILRYRLYNIELIINRTLVYGSLTAILAAGYVAIITLLQRAFISASGQKSDTAVVMTAFVVVVAFSPVKDWLQRLVDRRLGRGSPTVVLDKFMTDVNTVISAMDVDRVACRLLDQAVIAFDARSATLYLQSGNASKAVHSSGRLNGDAGIEVPLRYEGKQLGRLLLGRRRGDLTYTERDRDVLQRSADTVGEALALAGQLGHRPSPKSR
ncbi:MAG TPA: hypothetical protein VGX22_04735 [Candidatus Dormibacteraeota bacterium]|nr:hypothetical protein [Candidatus Dormibacteraeota bacterium]